MRRRRVIAALLLSLAAPLGAEAQPAGRVYRLGYLATGQPPEAADQRTAATLITTALRELEYVEGRNLVIERRYAEGKIERLRELARQLVRRRVDVILAIGTAAVRAAKEETATIPIVMYSNTDPVATGLVASLAKPEGNVTGLVIAPGGTLAAKKLELLTQAVPRVSRVAVLAPDDPNAQTQLQELQTAAATLGVQLMVVAVAGRDYERAFATIAAGRPGALFVMSHSYFNRDRKPIIGLAAKYRLPAMYEWREQVEDGGLMTYGGSVTQQVRRLATYIDRILKGVKPADLPIEQPTTLELVINLKTAKALGLTIPPSLLLLADQVIE
jgi:putative ABC transport system substrate-binding protein